MKTAYFVTTIRKNFQCRTVGWYSELKDAEECVEKNYCDIYEDGYYPFAVIEEVKEGIYPIPGESEQWYEWDKSKEQYIKCEKPEFFKNCVNFAIG